MTGAYGLKPNGTCHTCARRITPGRVYCGRCAADRDGAPSTLTRRRAAQSEQHDGPGVASQAVDTSTTESRRSADAAPAAYGAQPRTQGKTA